MINKHIQDASLNKYTFVVKDLSRDTIPQVDLIICRDVLQHLPEKMIFQSLENISKSNFKITNIMGEIIESGTLNGSTGIQSIDVSNLAEGNYNISLMCNENYKSLQFMIIK